MIIAGMCLLSFGTATAKIMPKFVPAETRLYNFTDDVLNAVEQCSSYRTNFSVKDTPYERLEDFAGTTEVIPEFEIYGIKHGLCRMQVRFSALGKGEKRFNCGLNNEQRVALLQAMQDTSTEEYVITLPAPSEQDCSGCNETTTFSGNMFDTMAATLKSRACVERHLQPTKNEIIEARTATNRFSDETLDELKNCVARTVQRETATLQDDVKIIGVTEDEKCHLSYLGFDLKVRKRDLKTVSGYDDMQRLLINNLDTAQYQYEDKYDATGMLFALAECRDENGTYTADENVFQRGNIQARTGLRSHRVKNVCEIELKNTVAVADIYYRDHSLICSVSDAYWPRLLKKYQHLIDSFGRVQNTDKNGVLHRTSAQYTAETRVADAEIFKQIKNSRLCVSKPPVDPIKLDADRFLYRDAPVSK